MMNTYVRWFWILAILNLVDFVLTREIIRLGGGEANPFANFFMQLFGTAIGMLIVKIPPLCTLGYIVHYRQDILVEWIEQLMKVVAGVYLGVIIYSVWVLLVLTGVILL